MENLQTIEVPIEGMDCAECSMHVQKAIASLNGVDTVDVFLASEKAVIRLDMEQVDLPSIRKAVERAGYSVPEATDSNQDRLPGYQDFTRPILKLLGLVFGIVLFVVVVGEWLGLFEVITSRVPWLVGVAVVLVGGYPVFIKVIRAALNRQVISHTLMTLGVIAALAVGEWATAAVVVFFMRVGDYVESFTADRARQAVRDLTRLAPQTARVERQGEEVEVLLEQVVPGDLVVVRPGEMIPVDGEVVGGQATVNQASITGESMPVEAGPGSKVYAATLVSLGSLQVRTTHVGPDSTYGRVIKLVEGAEAHKADVQLIADRFSAYYLPLVAGIAALTYLIRRDPLATAAVLVVACSCSFALATPIAMLASIGASAKRGLMVKGGKYLELLARADVLLIDKTGTLTLGKPQITDIVDIKNCELGIRNLESESLYTHMASPISPHATPAAQFLSPDSQLAILQMAASAERYSEHPLAEAVRLDALQRGVKLFQPHEFEAVPGMGVLAVVDGQPVRVGSRRFV
ncbi:MAG: heavy metal translocating P-type ATPase, partial [Anaerolineales bacterium]